MIYVTEVHCSRCGRPLRIYPGANPNGDGNLHLKIGTDGSVTAAAHCMNISTCDEYKAANPPIGNG